MGKHWVPPMANDKHHRLCNCRGCNADPIKWRSPEQKQADEKRRNGLA